MKKIVYGYLATFIIISIELSSFSISSIGNMDSMKYTIHENISSYTRVFPCGSAGPLIGMFLERWAKTIGSYYVYPTQYKDFEIIRGMITDKIDDRDNIIVVDKNGYGNYTSIQAAVDNAEEGDAIIVYSGVYNETIMISKPLWVIGIEKEFSSELEDDKPRINSNGSTVIITADNVTFYGFKINGNIGIEIKANNTKIWKNSIYVNSTGIKIKNNNSMVLYNTITSNGYGIQLNNSHNMNISWNTIEALTEDLYLEYVNNSFIMMNNLYNATLGVYVGRNSINNALKYNNFIGDKQNALCGNNRNMWDKNYWSDYNGTDGDNDGIGDTPYISSNIIDKHPLINPFHDMIPAKPRINPDEKGTLCGKTEVEIPFYCLFNDADSNILYCKWLWGENNSSWMKTYDNIPFEITNRWSSHGKYMVTVVPVYVIIRDQYGLFNISNPYEIHIYDLTAIKNRFIRRVIDLLMPTYFLSGWN